MLNFLLFFFFLFYFLCVHIFYVYFYVYIELSGLFCFVLFVYNYIYYNCVDCIYEKNFSKNFKKFYFFFFFEKFFYNRLLIPDILNLLNKNTIKYVNSASFIIHFLQQQKPALPSLKGIRIW